MGYVEHWLTDWVADLKDRRESARMSLPLVAYYWNGSSPHAYQVKAVSPEGAYIVTPDRWYVGTVLRLTIQYNSSYNESDSGTMQAPPSVGDDPEMSHVVRAKLVRIGPDGVGVRLIYLNRLERRSFKKFLADAQARKFMMIAERQNAFRKGQALVEFALILPLLFLLIVNVVNFGAFFFAWITVANAARSGAQYMCLGGASVGFLKKAASSAQIYNLVSADISSLRNRSSLAVRSCTQNFGVAAVCTTTGTGTFTNPAADTRTEAPLFVMGWVDVQYTYVPLIPVFSFSKLGVHATLPPLTIHRQSVMRIIQ